MCTKLEQDLAITLNSLIEKYELQEEYSELMPTLEALIAAEIKETKVSYSYEGLDCLKKTEAQRRSENHGLCKVVVKQGDSVILTIYWDASLQWIMKPDETGKRFTPVYFQKLPTGGATRQYLRKLADAEVILPGSFAKKYYPAAPCVVTCA